MIITINDPDQLQQLRHASDPVELRSPDGHLLGHFTTANRYTLPPGVKSPYTHEEIEEARKDHTGRPLLDILRELANQHG